MEYSPLQAVDFSLGRLLVEVCGAQKHDHGPLNWQAFLKRENRHKILRGDFETVNDILKSMESSEKNASQDGKLKTNPVNVPLIVYGRKPHITVSDPDAAAYIFDKAVTDDDGKDLRLSAAQLDIEYRIAMLAWDRPTLEMMQLAWLFHVAKPEQHRLSYDMKLGDDSEITITGELRDPKTPMFEDASLTREEGRLHAVILPVTVKTYAIMGDGKPIIPDGFCFTLDSPLDSWFGPGSDWGVGGNPFDPDDPANNPGVPGGGDPNNPGTPGDGEPGGDNPGGGTGGICGGLSCWPNQL